MSAASKACQQRETCEEAVEQEEPHADQVERLPRSRYPAAEEQPQVCGHAGRQLRHGVAEREEEQRVERVCAAKPHQAVGVVGAQLVSEFVILHQ
jgi:hypothetical protein